MATTRLMPLHVGKGRDVSTAIADIIDYAENRFWKEETPHPYYRKQGYRRILCNDISSAIHVKIKSYFT